MPIDPVHFKAAVDCVAKWDCLAKYPMSENQMKSLATAVVSMCPLEKLPWLRDKVLHGLDHVPAPIEIRRIISHGADGFKPLDGLEIEDVDMDRVASGE